MKNLPINNSKARPSDFRSRCKDSESDIARFAAQRRLREPILQTQCLTFFEAFQREAFLAIRAGESDRTHLPLLFSLLHEKLSNFSNHNLYLGFTPEGNGARIMLALAFVADAAITSSRDEAFAKLAAARQVLPPVKALTATILSKSPKLDDESEAQQSNLSVRSLGVERKTLKRGNTLGVSSGNPGWAGNPFER